MAKQVYNVIIQTGDCKNYNKGFISYHKVNSMDKFKVFADSKFPDWRFITVYDHKTRAKLYTAKNAPYRSTQVIVKDGNFFPTFENRPINGG